MESERVLIEAIRCEKRLRAANPERIDALAKSIQRLGLQTPITVRIVREFLEDDGGTTTDVPILVSGMHRLEAAKSLGWPEIDAFVMECDDRDFRLWEIAENLHRAELTVQERSEHIAEWVRLTGEGLKAQVAPLECTHDRGRENKGINAAVRDLGIDRTEAQRAVKIAALAPEAKEAARSAGLDNNQSALLSAAREETPSAQVATIEAEARKRQEAALAREEERQRIRDAEEAHKLNKQEDRIIALTEAQQFAAWLMERTDLHELPVIISWLEGCKAKDVIAALRRVAA